MSPELPTNQLPAMLDRWQATTNWQPSPTQLQQFQQFYQSIAVANHSLNLTRIVEPEAFWEKHLWDSVQPLVTTADLAGPAIDVGTGGGFPGVPLAIVRPAWAVTMVDSTTKKINFIRSCLPVLQLKNAQALTSRAETLGQDLSYRQQYGVVTMRAVAAAVVCAEYALPLLAIGGTAILYRGQWTAEEQADLEGVVTQLGGTVANITTFTTPLTHSMRHCVFLHKVSDTPRQFPRAVGLPPQKPLTSL